MAYGTLPIVRETGGLKDTVKPYDAEAKKGSRVSAAEKDGKKARKLKASGKVI